VLANYPDKAGRIANDVSRHAGQHHCIFHALKSDYAGQFPQTGND
jgi:hypothetical protein